MDKQNLNILIVTATLNSIYIAPETINNITEDYQFTHTPVDECWTIIDIVSVFQNAHQSLFKSGGFTLAWMLIIYVDIYLKKKETKWNEPLQYI